MRVSRSASSQGSFTGITPVAWQRPEETHADSGSLAGQRSVRDRPFDLGGQSQSGVRVNAAAVGAGRCR